MNPAAVDIKEPIIQTTITERIPLSAGEERVLGFFPDAGLAEWEDWRWQLKNRIRSLESISGLVTLTDHEKRGVQGAGDKLTMSIPPYFASLIDEKDPGCPIRLQSVPQDYEFETTDNEMLDPCGEEKNSHVHGLVHRYPDRVLFLVSEMCAMYCRYCTRSRMVGDGAHSLNTSTYDAALEYIRSHKEIRDVLISGGDPLTLSDKMLEYLISSIKAIPHVEFVRIGTRVPATLPQRITPELMAMFKKYSPVWMSVHFNHPKEITARVKQACNMIADAGIPMGSQTVLLRGINDSPEVMKKLFHELLKLRVRPYYIYQCDPIVGSRHFRTSVATGINIMENLRGHTSGYAVPAYVIDGPGGGGKIPVNPDYLVSKENGRYTLRNYAGGLYTYYDPTY
ncbi:MAG: KamA family radical SAM protein [Candidatus Omnitrophica bacterium]|nr:KamA family radical SAM protein [Candidatus Omnitrophota bacterium]